MKNGSPSVQAGQGQEFVPMIRMYSTVMVAGNVVVESGDPGQFPPTARLLHGEGQAEGMVDKPPSNLVPPTRHSMHVLVDPIASSTIQCGPLFFFPTSAHRTWPQNTPMHAKLTQ